MLNSVACKSSSEGTFSTKQLITTLVMCSMLRVNECSVDHVIAKSHMYLQVIWGNLNVHIGNKPAFWDNFSGAQIIYISDLLDDNLKLKSIQMLYLEFGINIKFCSCIN